MIEHHNEMNKDATGSYASVNGLNMHYEIHGIGRPLVLLHSNLLLSIILPFLGAPMPEAD